MTKFKDVKKGYEIEFIDSNKQKTTALVSNVDEKTFSVETWYFIESEKEWDIKTLYWFKSGKKVNRFHNWGNAIKIVNKWNN